MSRTTYDGTALLTPEDFRLLRDLLAQRTGLSFSADARPSVERRLRERLAVVGVTTGPRASSARTRSGDTPRSADTSSGDH